MRTMGWAMAFVLLAASASSAQSLAEMARQQRQRAARAGTAPVYTNSDLPRSGGISVIGPAGTGKASAPAVAPADAASVLARQADQEAMWRGRFAHARQQLASDRARLEVSQREYNLARMQYYSNPNVALQQQYTQSDLKKRGDEMELLRQKIAADEKALSDLSDQLRRQGLPPGWGR